MITATQTPTVLHGERSITYRWEIGPSTETWLGTPGTDVAELQVHHFGHGKQFTASLHQVTVLPNGGTRCAYALAGPSWSRRESVARYSAARLAEFAEWALAALRDTEPSAIEFAFSRVAIAEEVIY